MSGCSANLHFAGLELAVGLHSALWTVKPTSFVTYSYLSGCYTGTKLYCLVTEARGCEQLAHSHFSAVPRPGIEPATC